MFIHLFQVTLFSILVVQDKNIAQIRNLNNVSFDINFCKQLKDVLVDLGRSSSLVRVIGAAKSYPLNDSRAFIRMATKKLHYFFVVDVYETTVKSAWTWDSVEAIVNACLLFQLIIVLSSINLILPTLTLYSMSMSDFGRHLEKVIGIKVVYQLLHLCVINIPFLGVGIYLW